MSCTDNLTLGEIKELMKIFGGNSPQEKHPHIGRQVIIRSYGSGVHFGMLESYISSNGRGEVLLKDARRLWYWKGDFTLSWIAENGLKDGSKLDSSPEIYVTDVLEVIPCSKDAVKSIGKVKDYVA